MGKKEHLQGIEILDSYQVLRDKVTEARSKDVDLVVGVYHGGIEKDLETGSIYTSTTGENQGYKFCEDFDLDILIAGHKYQEIVSTVNGVLVTQSTNKAQSMM